MSVPCVVGVATVKFISGGSELVDLSATSKVFGQVEGLRAVGLDERPECE